MKLITETVEQVEFLTEAAADGGKNYFIEGTFMQADTLNRNKRMYPKHILLNEVNRYTKEFVNNSRAFGELNHPSGPTVNLDRVAIIIKELNCNGTDVYGKAKVMSTPMGEIVKNLINEGARLGVSTRGMGSLKAKNGYNEVQPDFMLSAVDIVADPSAPNAFVNGIMEGKEWIWDNGILVEKQIEEYHRQLTAASKRELEQKAISLFEDFMRKLK
jgi:hypothetical protein